MVRNKIKELRKAKNLTASELAELANTTQAQISRLENGQRALDFEWTERLSKALGVKPLDLIDDESWKLPVHDRVSSTPAPNPWVNKLYGVPLVPWGEIINFLHDAYIPDGNMLVPTTEQVSDKAFAVKINDNSLEPRFMEGDFIIVDPAKRTLDGEFCLIDPSRNGKIEVRKFEENESSFTFSALKENGPMALYAPNTGYENLPIVGAVVDMKVNFQSHI